MKKLIVILDYCLDNGYTVFFRTQFIDDPIYMPGIDGESHLLFSNDKFKGKSKNGRCRGIVYSFPQSPTYEICYDDIVEFHIEFMSNQGPITKKVWSREHPRKIQYNPMKDK